MQTANLESSERKPPMHWKTILVPTDLSERSKQAVKAATYLAEQCNAKITLLHVIQVYSGSFEGGAAADHFVNLAREYLDRMADEIPAELVGDKLVSFGPDGTFLKIVETADAIASDLIVMATHSYGPVKRALFGSLATSVIRHAPCAVLVVSPHPPQMNQSTI